MGMANVDIYEKFIYNPKQSINQVLKKVAAQKASIPFFQALLW